MFSINFYNDAIITTSSNTYTDVIKILKWRTCFVLKYSRRCLRIMTAERSSKAYTVTCNLDSIIHCFNSLCVSPACNFTSSESQLTTRQQTFNFFALNRGTLVWDWKKVCILWSCLKYCIDDQNLVSMYLPGFNVYWSI